METLDRTRIEAMLGPKLTAEQAQLIYAQGADAVIFALLVLAKRLAEQRRLANRPDPSAPSTQTPPYLKPTRSRRAKPRGAQPGHPGHRRATPPRIDRYQEHTLSACPTCQGPVSPCQSTRTRIVEDIPEDIQPIVTQHTIRRYWCSTCQTHVEPAVPDALPGSQIGLRVVVLAAWLHYLLGTTLA
jgi:transposase